MPASPSQAQQQAMNLGLSFANAQSVQGAKDVGEEERKKRKREEVRLHRRPCVYTSPEFVLLVRPHS